MEKYGDSTPQQEKTEPSTDFTTNYRFLFFPQQLPEPTVCKDGTKIIAHLNLYGFLVRGLFEGFSPI
jgi:hypothetical protein